MFQDALFLISTLQDTVDSVTGILTTKGRWFFDSLSENFWNHFDYNFYWNITYNYPVDSRKKYLRYKPWLSWQRWLFCDVTFFIHTTKGRLWSFPYNFISVWYREEIFGSLMHLYDTNKLGKNDLLEGNGILQNGA